MIDQPRKELDPAKRAALFIKTNEILIQSAQPTMAGGLRARSVRGGRLFVRRAGRPLLPFVGATLCGIDSTKSWGDIWRICGPE